MAANATAVASDPPRPRVVISRSTETPWKPATTGTLPPARASRRRSPLTSLILARVWSLSVMIPTWLPVNDCASTPRSASAITRSDIEMRSPVLTSMSYSRGGWVVLTELARWMSSSVVFPMALTTATTSEPCRRCPRDVVGDSPDPIGVADRGPTELLHDQRHPAEATDWTAAPSPGAEDAGPLPPRRPSCGAGAAPPGPRPQSTLAPVATPGRSEAIPGIG